MLLENGFNIKNENTIVNSVGLGYKARGATPIIIGETTSNDVGKPKSIDYTIAYVKITSTEPYVQTTEIALSIETLNKHKAGLIKLLEYYVTNKSFSYDLNLSKYNDYLHLSR